MRSRRAPPTLFNFSFLDILACTVGAVLFALMTMALQLSEGVVPSAAAELQQLEESRQELERALQARLEDPHASERVQLLEEQARLRREARANRGRAREVEAAAAKRLRALSGKSRKVLELQPAVAREANRTSKALGLTLDCRPGQVDLVEPQFDRQRGKAKLVVIASEPERALNDRGTSLANELERLSRHQHYVYVLLRPGAIATFLELRSVLKRHDLEIAWQPISNLDRVLDFQFEQEKPRTD